MRFARVISHPLFMRLGANTDRIEPMRINGSRFQFFQCRFFPWLLLWGVLFGLVACSPPLETPAGPSPTLATSTLGAATLTPHPSPSLPPTATLTPSSTASPTPKLHPMNILAMRQTPYPGSQIQIVETLDPGANYYRYIAYYESEGLKIYGLLTVPFGETPASGWPAIVFNHGYIPPEQYKSTERYIAYVNNLAANGYIVYRIDYRGHDRSDGEPSGAYGSPGYTVDVLNAVASLKAFPPVDPARIGMWGHSMGGFLTLRAMVISPDIKAAVIWAGVVASYPDLICCWRTPTPGPTPTPFTATLDAAARPGWRSNWQQEYGSPEENLKFWLGVSANSYLADLSGPIQLHHGTADTEVPIKFSRDFYQQLLAAGQTAEFYEYEGDDHNLAGSFSLAMTRTLNFFEKYLKGNPSP